MNVVETKIKKALLVYVGLPGTGLSNKSQKIEKGFSDKGYELDTIYYTNKGNKLYRFWELMIVHARYFYLNCKNNYDVVYIRYAYFFVFIYMISFFVKNKIQIDINSNVQGELKSRGQKFRAKIDWITMKIAIKAACKVHVVSRELLDHYSGLFPESNVVLTHNFVVDEIYPVEKTTNNNKKINIVFLGNTAQLWHGIQKFVEAIIVDQHWFSENCTFHIIGHCSPEIHKVIDHNNLENNIVLHGFLSGIEKEKQLQVMDIGIGCFDLGVIGLKETSSIKICEYLHVGLPVIFGCEDTVVSRDLSFIQVVDLADSMNAQSKIKSFVEFYIQHPEIRMDAHRYARDNLLVNQYIESIIT